ncbi:hypothetical protein D3C78_1365470 [compost metagenome]
MYLVEIGQLLALFVHLPVIGIAPQHDEIIRPVGHGHPCAHDRHVHILRRESVLELVIGVLGIFRMLGLQDMRRTGAEARIGHGVEILLGKSGLEGPFDGVIIDLFQRRSFTKGLRRGAAAKR